MTEEQKRRLNRATTKVALVVFGYHYTIDWIEEYLTIEECDAVRSLYQMLVARPTRARDAQASQDAVDDIMSTVYERNPKFRTRDRMQGLATGRGQHR